ncbi:MAG: aminoglycoside phosphotransferase family protein [Arenimonas sp.]
MTLAASLASVFGDDVEVLDRTRNLFTSTFPSEIVTCRLKGGLTRRMLCKHTGGQEHNAFGHRAGLGYEGMVYRRVLVPLGVSAPALYGEFTDSETGEPWLAIEYVDEATLADGAPDIPRALELASAWAGRFHALTDSGAFDFLTRYDRDYYAQWAARTSVLAVNWHSRLPWLEGLCSRAWEMLGGIADLKSTVIHGEFTPHNILVRGDEIFPIDWESAAIGLPEIDLVCLVDKWPQHIASRCEQAYAMARFRSGVPPDWNRTVDLARLYWDFRWLGDRPDWTASEKVGPRFEHLRGTSERLGLL